MRILNEHKNKKNNKGSTFEIVLISISFIVILALLAISAAMLNLNMKLVDRNAKKGFYTAEEAVAELYAGLGKLSMESLERNYTEILETAENYSDNKLNNQNLRQGFTKYVVKKLFPNCVADSEYSNWTIDAADVDKFKEDYIDKESDTFEERLTQNYIEDNRYIKVQSVGDIWIEKSVSSVHCEGSGDLYNYALKFNDCVLQYKNEKGYKSTVKVDCNLALPDVEVAFSEGVGNKLTTFDSFSLVGCSGIKIDESNTLNVNGTKIFAGKNNEINPSITGLMLANNSTINTNKALMGTDSYGSAIISDYNVSVSDNAKLNLDSSSRIWCNNLNVDGKAGNVNISGKTYVKDDLAIQGDNSKVTVGGEYTGWSYSGITDSTGTYNHELSSAMIVNGKNSILDLQNINSLVLGGNSYINFKRGINGANPGNSDTMYMTGEAVSLKGNQEIYLVPDAFIHVEGSEYHSNPMPLNEVDKISIQIPDDFADIEIDGRKTATGETPKIHMRDILNIEGVSGGIRSVDNGEFRYYYLDIKEDMKDLYVNAVMNAKDTDPYLPDLRNRLVADVTALKQQSLVQINAASQIYLNNGALFSVSSSENNKTSSAGSQQIASSKTKADFVQESQDKDVRYDLLCHILYEPNVNDTSLFSAYPESVRIGSSTVNINGTQNNSVFRNLINRSYLDYKTVSGGTVTPYTVLGDNDGALGQFKVYATEEPDITLSNLFGGDSMKNGIIISTGNVVVDHDYNGIIIAAGNITVKGNVNVTNSYAISSVSSDSAIELMLKKIPDETKRKEVRKFFRAFNNQEFHVADPAAEGEEDELSISIGGITYKDVVRFDNWLKNSD